MIGVERQLLRIVWQFKQANEEADSEKIAAEMGMSVGYVRHLCRHLVENNFLTGSPTKYRLTRTGVKAAAKRERRQRVKAK